MVDWLRPRDDLLSLAVAARRVVPRRDHDQRPCRLVFPPRRPVLFATRVTTNGSGLPLAERQLVSGGRPCRLVFPPRRPVLFATRVTTNGSGLPLAERQLVSGGRPCRLVFPPRRPECHRDGDHLSDVAGCDQETSISISLNIISCSALGVSITRPQSADLAASMPCFSTSRCASIHMVA